MPDDFSRLQEELLDVHDPLRHLHHADAQDIIPDQPPSVHDQLIHLHFPPSSDSPSSPSPVSIALAVDAAPGCGGIAWPAGEVLAAYLARRSPRALQGKSVLELGSGTGLVGLLAAARGARVCITDQTQLLPIMTRNIQLNAATHVYPVSVAELNWGQPIPSDIPSPESLDLLLAADSVYFEPAFPLLVKTLCDLVPPESKCEVLFCYKKRRKADRRFFALLKKHFTWEEVADDPDRTTYAREAISLLRLHRR